MMNEEGKDIRIIDLPDADQVEPGFYVPVDSYAGTKKYDLYEVTKEVDEAVDYISTVSAQIEGKADKSELDDLEDQIAGKADAAVVYTKDEVDGLLEAKVDADEVYGKDEIDSMIEGKADYSDLEVLSAALEEKADSADVYTIDVVNDLLDTKADTDSLDQVSGFVDLALDNIQDKFDSVEDILVTVADDISTVSGQIEGKASQDDLDTLDGTVSQLSEDVSTAQGDITELETAVGTKASSSDLNSLSRTVTSVQEEVNRISGNLDGLMQDCWHIFDEVERIKYLLNSVAERWVLTPEQPTVIGGRTYKTARMPDGKLWLAENLDYKFDGCGIGGSPITTTPNAWYYSNNETGYGIDGTLKCGLLYNWYAVKYLEDNKDTLIPPGWRIPTQEDYEHLFGSIPDISMDCSKLKAVDGSVTPYYPLHWNGTDDYDFGMLPAGYMEISSSSPRFKEGPDMVRSGTSIRFWTSREYGDQANTVFYDIDRWDYSTKPKEFGCYIRLVKDSVL